MGHTLLGALDNPVWGRFVIREGVSADSMTRGLGRGLLRDIQRGIFPSRTYTFGPVMLQAMACGTPVAAYPVTGPVDGVVDGMNGALDEDLGNAIRRALTIDRTQCRNFALARGWDAIAERMAAHLALIDWARPGVVSGSTVAP